MFLSIYIPPLSSLFLLLILRMSTEFTGNSMKVIRRPPGLVVKSAFPDDMRQRLESLLASSLKYVGILGQMISTLEASTSQFLEEGLKGAI